MKIRTSDGVGFTNRNSRRAPAAPQAFGRNLAVAVWLLVMATLVPATSAAQLLSARNPAIPLPAGGNDNSSAPSLSPDGRFVVFTSAANDLVPGGNSVSAVNVFLRDRTANTTVLVSGNWNGNGGGNGDSTAGQASTYGRYVVFQSDASDLVPGDTNGVSDIFLRDTFTGTTRLISVAANGGFANGASMDPVMTPDGTCVAFISAATNLVAGDTNGIPDVFVRDLITQTTWLVSVGALLPSGSTRPIVATPVITPDGRYVAFFSLATNLVSSVPSTSTGEVYVRDRLLGTMTWASTNASAIVYAAYRQNNLPSYHPRLSDNGRYVAFKAGATSTAGAVVILQYDSTTGTTALVNTNGIGCSVDLDDNDGPEMTPDGRFIAFDRHEGALLGGVSSSYSSVHVWDSQGAVDTLVSDNGSGVQSSSSSYAPVITPDGHFVAFLSNVANLTGNTISNGCHVYLRNLQSSTTQLVDVDTNGIGSTDDYRASLSLSADGRFVAFSSPDGRLLSLDKNRATDVFVRDLVAGNTGMISQRNAAVIPQSGDGSCWLPQLSVSADGRWVAFASSADDLVLNDTNQLPDVFVRDLVGGATVLASVGFDGSPARGGASDNPLISADGRYVVFLSSATNLIVGQINANWNVFRRDLQAGTNALVSVGTNGVSPGNGDASDPVMSPDGRYVAFLSAANNLVAGITSGVNTYWRDVNLGQTVGLQSSVNYYPFFDPSLSSNGRYIAYASNGSPFSQNSWLKIRDTQLGVDIYTNTGAVTSASIDPTGTKILYWMGDNPYWIANTLYVDNVATGTNLFSIPSKAPIRNATGWSDDGRWLTFVSSTNPVSGDDGTNKVYLRDFQTGTLSLIGTIGPSNSTMDVSSDVSVMSGNGRFVAYRSAVINTVIGDNTTPPNVFLLDRLTGSNTVLTAGQAGSSPIAWVSRPVLSDGGATAVFLDLGPGLATGDLNRLPDAFGVSVNTSAALVDSDADGIPDWWMMKYFGHPTGQAGDFSLASDDADGDGVSNLQEYIAGTDPTNPNSVFRLSTTAPVNGTMNMTWPAVMGKSYQMQYKTNLDDPVWLTAPGNIWMLGSQGYYLAPAAQSQSFYRAGASN
jgi:Tol biopolymer transport system component